MNLDVPADLYDMYGKLCIDYGITKTEGIVRYFRYLKSQNYKLRKVLNDRSVSDFKLDEREPE